MSSTTLRYTDITMSFLPYKRDHRLSRGLRSLRLRTSRRRAKQTIRHLVSRLKEQSYA